MKDPQAILLTQQLPPEFLAFLGGYIHLTEKQFFLFSYSFEVEGYFVALEVLKVDKSKKTWKVRIPIQFVLATADASLDKKGSKVGFLASHS